MKTENVFSVTRFSLDEILFRYAAFWHIFPSPFRQSGTDQEVERAKKHFQNWICGKFTDPEYRLFKYVMGMRFEQKPRTLPYILEMSRNVTTAQVRDMARNLMKKELTMIVQGGGALQVPSRDQIKTRFA